MGSKFLILLEVPECSHKLEDVCLQGPQSTSCACLDYQPSFGNSKEGDLSGWAPVPWPF